MRKLVGVAVIVVAVALLSLELSAQSPFGGIGLRPATDNVMIEGPQEWVPADITVQEGDQLSITASGWIIATNYGRSDWAFGPWNPDGKNPDGGVSTREQGIFHLQAKVGDTVFRVGSSWTGAAPATGTLYLGMADLPRTHFDNRGLWVVRVESTQSAIQIGTGQSVESST